MNISKNDRISYLKRFEAAFTMGIENIVSAAEIYVEAIDNDPTIAEEFHSTFQGTIPSSAWSGFEAVGRKWLHPKLLMGAGGRFSSKIKRLPYSAQSKIFDGTRFDMLVENGDSIKVDLREVTVEQAKQMFDCDHIRTLSEQKTYLASVHVDPDEPHEVMPYIIHGGKVFFSRNVELCKNEIRRILQDM